MAVPYHLDTTESLKGLIKSQGGDYHVDPAGTTYPGYSTTFMSAMRPPANYIPFVISLYNVETGEARYPLTLMVNPSDIQYGHTHAVQNAYTRRSWVTTYWGQQLQTLTVSGSSAGFYYNPNEVANTVRGLRIRTGGLTNYNRRNSLEFANLLALVSFFKRNGAYFLTDTADQTLWNDGTSRVINVMDFVMVSYDGADHVGAFNTFTLDDTASTPYRINYNFEFVVAGLRGDSFDGHLRKDGNEKVGNVQVSIQGGDMELAKTVRMNEDQMQKYYNVPPLPSTPGNARTYEPVDPSVVSRQVHDIPGDLDPEIICTYSQSTGEFVVTDKTGKVLWTKDCYSGKGEGINNPTLEYVVEVGPIPRGVWVIEPETRDRNNGAPSDSTVTLTPVGDNNTFQYGRSVFRIHGGYGPGNLNASRGCIIMEGKDLRDELAMWAGSGGAVVVVTE